MILFLNCDEHTQQPIFYLNSKSICLLSLIILLKGNLEKLLKKKLTCLINRSHTRILSTNKNCKNKIPTSYIRIPRRLNKSKICISKTQDWYTSNIVEGLSVVIITHFHMILFKSSPKHNPSKNYKTKYLAQWSKGQYYRKF